MRAHRRTRPSFFGARRATLLERVLLRVVPSVFEDALVYSLGAVRELAREVEALGLRGADFLDEDGLIARGERRVPLFGEAGAEAEVGEDRDHGAMPDEGVRGSERQGVGEEHRVRDGFSLAPADEVLSFTARHPEADPPRRPDRDGSGRDVWDLRVGAVRRCSSEVLDAGCVDENVGVEDGGACPRVRVVPQDAGDVENIAGVEFRVLAGVAVV